VRKSKRRRPQHQANPRQIAMAAAALSAPIGRKLRTSPVFRSQTMLHACVVQNQQGFPTAFRKFTFRKGFQKLTFPSQKI
jgi:hypothetical protein